MRTRALRVSCGAYDSEHWHAALSEDEYERGVLKNTRLLLCLWGDHETIRRHMNQAFDVLVESELERVANALAEAEPEPVMPLPAP